MSVSAPDARAGGMRPATARPGDDPPAARGGARPYHATPPVGAPASRRILLVSYHFPPSPSVGGLRWQKMAQVAVERGWGVDVVCLDPSGLAGADWDRLVDLPPDVRLFGVAERPGVPGRLIGAASAVWRRLVFRRGAPSSPGAAPAPAGLPSSTGLAGSVRREDARARRPLTVRSVLRTLLSMHFLSESLRWARDAARLARSITGPEHQVVISSGPPHFAHLAARAIARRAGLPYVMDLRDPWSLNELFPSGHATRFYQMSISRHEARAVRDAALVVCNTELASRAMRAEYPAAAERVVTVMNGSDDEPRPDVARDPRFLIAYTGAIYAGRTPEMLFRALARVIDERQLTPDRIGVELMGPVDVTMPAIDVLAREAGIEAFVTHRPPRPRAESARLLARATLLVSLPQEHDTAIPSKIFEYATYDAWMLVLAAPGSAPALVLQGTGADVVAPEDVEGIADVLRRHLDEHAAGVVPRAVGSDGRFSRRGQAALLLDRLDRVVARA